MDNRLKLLRTERRYSQQKVAMDLSLSQNSISRYESGVRGLDAQMLCRFADYYGVSVDYILGRTDNPNMNK